MERFIKKFNIIGEEANAIRLFYHISEQWTCSHLRRDCFINGLCAKQNFKAAIDLILDHDDVPAAHRLVMIAKNVLADRETVWLQSYRSFSQPYEEEVERKINIMGVQLLEHYQTSGMMEEAGKLEAQKRGERIRLDDSFAALPYLYIPIAHHQILNPLRVMRFRQIGYYFYNPEFADDWIPPDAYAIRSQRFRICRGIQERIPVCLETGFKGPVFQVMFLPVSMLPMFEDQQFRKHINWYMSAAVKVYLQIGTNEERRFALQLFGMCPAGESPIHQMMLGRIIAGGRETNLVALRSRIQGNMSWESWLLPMFLVRVAVQERAFYDDVEKFMRMGFKCQLCYMKTECLRENAYYTDVRTSEMLGVPITRAITIREHVSSAESMVKFSVTGSEHIGRIGDHYFTCEVHSSMEALIFTLTQIHKWIRGSGIWSGTQWREGIYMLARLLIRWPLTKKQISAAYRLFCFVCYGYAPRRDGSLPNWDDLGKFLDIILNGPELNMAESEQAFALMFDLGRYIIMIECAARTQIPGFAAPECDEGEIQNLTELLATMWQ
ncbi:NS1 [Pata virus]|nr:NS1 [Pata virus]